MKRALFFFVPLLLLTAIEAPRGYGYETTIDAVPPLTVSVQNLGGRVFPPQGVEVKALGFRLDVQGLAGSTNAVFRISDGTNTCDCAFACNAATGNKRVLCTGTAGTGCKFTTDSNITYSWQSAGNCATPPVILGNIAIGGEWQ